MKRGNASTFLVAAALCVASLCIIVISVASGPRIVNPFSMDSETCQILLAIRLPRTAIALLMGGALGASGAILQGIFRNPLADPYILGISSGASLAASFGLMFGISLFTVSVPILAFIGAIATGAAVVILGRSA